MSGLKTLEEEELAEELKYHFEELDELFKKKGRDLKAELKKQIHEFVDDDDELMYLWVTKRGNWLEFDGIVDIIIDIDLDE